MTSKLSRISKFSLHLLGLFFLLWPPFFVYFFHISCDLHKCSLSATLKLLWTHPSHYFSILKHRIDFSVNSMLIYYGWMGLQLILYLKISGYISRGHTLASGTVLLYKINGLKCFLISNLFVIVLAYLGFLDSSVFADRIFHMITLANISGILLTVFVYLKANLIPNKSEDCAWSGSPFYDIYMGVEHSPRIGRFDFKQFFNARPGIALWTLTNLSFAAKQYAAIGTITNSMIAINILQAYYVVDLFLNEEWYMRTIDIAHDHFGFYLAWGDLAWLPFMYNLQGLYLVHNPITLSTVRFLVVLLMGVAAMLMFRLINNQKDWFRNKMSKDGYCEIWGKPASFLKVDVETSDGKKITSYLLCSGYLGMARHLNYVPDLINSLAYGMCCGFDGLMPYFYLIYMFILLTHRIRRDHIRCLEKYGSTWEEYCKRVPYKMIPFVY